MYRQMLKSKIHRGNVTGADLNYIGSITVDGLLMEQADMIENEKVTVLNINNGARFSTYVVAGKKGSGEICLNGAAARLVQVGDKVIILAYGFYDPNELKDHTPSIIHVDEENQIIQL
jgi:aspartate 1-decarboxylase